MPCRDSKAPFTFVLNLMVPGPRNVALVVSWAAEDPAQGCDRPALHDADESGGDTDSDSGASPFDTCLARCKGLCFALNTLP